MLQAISPRVENTYFFFQNPGVVQWRPETKASNKLQLNMKNTLNSKLKSKTIVNVNESSSKEDTKPKEMED